MRVHTGGRANGKTTQTFADTLHLLCHKPVTFISPSVEMSRHCMEQFRCFVLGKGFPSIIGMHIQDRRIDLSGRHSIHFRSWEEVNKDGQMWYRGKENYTVIDEVGKILQRMFPLNTKVMTVNLEHSGEDL